jgi:5-formyltetrahydrofolate cyclo-ligase
MDKKKLRRSLIQTRISLSEAEWKLKSDRLCHHLKSASIFQQAQTILAYFSFRQEPDLSFLFNLNLNSEFNLDTTLGKKWGFPRCVGKALVWHSWQPGDPLETGAFGIREPLANALILSPDQVDLILVPAVACDWRGYRLGYGGGFYDRLLNDPEWSEKPTIGIVFEFARLPELPIDPWDKPLDAICTDYCLTNRVSLI